MALIFWLAFTLFGLLQAMQLSPYSRMNALNSHRPSRARCLGPKCHAVPPKIKYDWVMENDKTISALTNELPPPTVIRKKHDHPFCLVPKLLVMGACTIVEIVTFLPYYCYHMGQGNPVHQFLSQVFFTAYSIHKELVIPPRKIEHFGNITFYVCPPGYSYYNLKTLEQTCFTKVLPYQRFCDQEDRILHTAVRAKEIEENITDPKDLLKMIAAKYQKFVLVPFDLDNEEILPTSPVFTIKRRGKEIVFCKD